MYIIAIPLHYRFFDIALSILEIKGLDAKALRAFRVLRPLRFLSGIPSKSIHYDLRIHLQINYNVPKHFLFFENNLQIFFSKKVSKSFWTRSSWQWYHFFILHFLYFLLSSFTRLLDWKCSKAFFIQHVSIISQVKEQVLFLFWNNILFLDV